jgi:hypothetical protein
VSDETTQPSDGDELQPDRPEGQRLQIQMQLVETQVDGARVGTARDPETGARALVLDWPVVLRLVIPLDEEGARSVARELTGGIEIASGLPVRRGGPVPGL